MNETLTERVDAALRGAFAAAGLPTGHAFSSKASRPEAADLQCNGAMPTAKALGRPPREVAAAVVAALAGRPEFSEATVAGPGFVNIRVSDGLLADVAAEALRDPALGVVDEGKGRLAVVDFGGPNVAKPLHVGHLRSLVIGESLRRVLAASGWRVVADAHLGDWGLQMGMLTAAIRRADPRAEWFVPGHAAPWPDVPVTLEELERLYPEAASACRDDPERMAEARADTAALQAGDPGLLALWGALRSLSLAAQERDFGTLGVRFDLLLGESDAHPLVAPMVEDLRARGLAVEDDGALVVDVRSPDDRKEVPPLLLAKRDGAALYATTDLATLVDRVRTMGAARIVYVVDQRQALHFEQVFRAARKASIAGDATLEHVGFGTVNGPDGKPYRTRQGGVARLADLLSEAVAKAAERLEGSDAAKDLDAEGKAELARTVGVGAVKYADLSGDRLTGYAFDADRMVSFEGRTGPYLQYACVRVASVMAKAAERGEVGGTPVLGHPAERALLLACLAFPDAVAEAARRLQPGVVAAHAYDVAQAFSRFYADCPVVGAEDRDVRSSRLGACTLTGMVLRASLGLLGIDVPVRM